MDRFEQACSGEASLVLVTGAGGAGKTTFLADAGRRLRDLGALVLDARCRPSLPALRPLLEMVRSAAEQLRLEGDRSPLAGLSPVLDALAGQASGRGGSDLGSRRLEFFDEIARLLALLAETRPLVLLIHDLELADPTTRELFHYLARVLSSRPELGRTAFRGLLVASAQEPGVLAGGLEGLSALRIELGGLDQAGVRAYLSSETVVRQVMAATGGVPAALDGMLARLGQDGSAPSRLDAVSLDPAERELLHALAAFGRPLGPETLRLLTGLPQERLARGIAQLVERQLLEKSIVDGELRLGFARAGDQAAVYSRMTELERRTLHAAIGTHLEGKGELELETCAEHLLRGGCGARAVRVALAAGQRLEAALCFERAAELYERALAASAELAPATRHQLLDRLCTICEITGQLDCALAHALELARGREQDPEAALRVAHLHLIHGDFAAARLELTQLQDGLREGRLAGDRRLSARILAEVADAQHLAGETEAAQQSAAKGLLLCCATEGEPALAQTRLALQNTLAKIHLERDEHEAARRLWLSNLELARSSGLPAEEVRALIQLGLGLMRGGRYAEADARYQEARERAEALGELRLLAACQQHRGVLADRRGDLAAALEAYQQAVGLWKRIGHRSFLAWVGVDLGLLYLRVGDVAKAQAMAELSEKLGDREPPAAARINLELLRGQIARREARLVEAAERFNRARRLAAEASQVERERRDLEEAWTLSSGLLGDAPHHLRLRALLLAGSVEVALERLEPAAAHLAEARELAESLDDLDAIWQVSFHLSRLARAQSRPARAARLLAEAARGEERARAAIPAEFWAGLAELPPRTALRVAREEVGAAPTLTSLPPGPRSEEEERPSPRPARRGRCGAIIGGHARMLQLYDVIDKVAPADATVLIRGESGTGKELVAEAIHRRSRRSGKPFVKVNCGALVESLLLSELFGHERGAFTGATQRKKGRFELADGGTIFLDEIGDISPKTQVALLRVLQEREFERVGGTAPIHVDVRVICATNRDLESMVARGEFREDLYYRLNGVRLEVPPLRERIEDLSPLIAHFLERIASERGSTMKALTPAALRLLESYGWPGNVRELDNVLRSVSLLTDGDMLDATDFADYPELAAWASRASVEVPEHPLGSSGEVASAYAQVRSLGWSLKEYKKRIEVECIQEALREAEGNITRAAELLGMKRPRLSQLIKEHGIA